jgi:hypothetical protein
MSKSKLHYSVVLTEEARKLLAAELSEYLIDDRCFNCISIDPNGPYLFMQIDEKNTKSKMLPIELSIPHYYVLYIASAVSRKTLGLKI